MRRVIVAGNWKMNTTPDEAGPLATAIANANEEPEVSRVIFPPFVCLAAVRDALAGTRIEVGAQNVHAEPAGPYTGEVSAAMIRALAGWSIVGHSERRRDQCESDVVIGRKLVRCLEHDLRPILCVGERLPEREAGRAEEVVRAQLGRALAELSGREEATRDWLVVAYEPVWAIGTGRTARGQDAAEMAAAIRDVLGEHGWRDGGQDVPVLYGGSVTSATVGEFLAEPSLDGALVGGASLKVDEMAGIVARAGVTARARSSAGAFS
ncbi:MAG: triose-phosphate isomerase [Chloroflexota bacterium]|nr:triose-phosphate isomerase [Chloroflexota bacterium]